jgi:hypothetical protein
MSYELLLNDLEALQKSYAADEDDKAIRAAAEGNDEELDEDGNPIAKKPAAKPDGDEGKPFGKSFTLIAEDGTEAEAIDGTDLIKSLQDEVVALGQSAKDEKEDLTKSITILSNVIKSQGSLIKSLQEDVAKLSNQGAGRKSIMAPTQDMAKSMQPISTETFMMKANAAFNAGRISGKELTVCDVSMRHNESIEPALISKIFAE